MPVIMVLNKGAATTIILSKIEIGTSSTNTHSHYKTNQKQPRGCQSSAVEALKKVLSRVPLKGKDCKGYYTRSRRALIIRIGFGGIL